MPYSAVVTTGIYCRAECSAQPNPENVRTYLFPAGAEAAGFRPCLRCRPDRAPGVADWTAPSEIVCRALHLIEDGALDGANADALARRLGVSERHLRRLFDQHVGASPDAVARSRRAHFARRLLDETDLPVADIAFAAGFQSVRQMNRVMTDTFRFTPTELRRRRRTGDLLPGPGLQVRLPFRPPLDFDQLLRFLAARAIPRVEAVDLDAGRYQRTVALDGGSGTITVERGGGDGHLVVAAAVPSYRGFIHAVERVRRLFDLGADIGGVEETLGTDEILGPLVARRPGLRVPGCWDPFELAVRAVLGQQVSVAAATTLAGRIVDRYGAALDNGVAGPLDRLFPSPAVLAGADLRSCGLTGARAGTVRALAEAVAAGALELDTGGDFERLLVDLTALPGIGPWTATYVAMRTGAPDAFPASDLGIRKALATADGSRPDPREVAARAQAWSPWRSYAALHLWASLADGEPVRKRPDLMAASA